MMMAASGSSLAQIKQVTDHRSDTVVQRYIDSSIHTKCAAAGNLALRDGSQEAPQMQKKRKSVAVEEDVSPSLAPTLPSKKAAVNNHYHFNFTNATIGAPVAIGGNNNGFLGGNNNGGFNQGYFPNNGSFFAPPIQQQNQRYNMFLPNHYEEEAIAFLADMDLGNIDDEN